jgi:hypothetical protein
MMDNLILFLFFIMMIWFFGLGYAIGIYKQTLKDIKALNENAAILKYFKEKYEKALPKTKKE